LVMTVKEVGTIFINLGHHGEAIDEVQTVFLEVECRCDDGKILKAGVWRLSWTASLVWLQPPLDVKHHTDSVRQVVLVREYD
jgi:hypothetical protein